MNKRIGILTYHRAINYGAILQTYALQKKINDLGFECDIIDYRSSPLENLHKKKKISEAKNFKQLARDIILAKNYNLKYDKFRNFAKDNMNFSSTCYNIYDLKKIENKYDKFIVGSDQVWNYHINKLDPVYFLSFVDNRFKKASYAASIGVNKIPQKYQDSYKLYLNSFNEILVREKQGAKIINNLTAKEAKVVLDPTLLITKDEWFEIAKENLVGKEKYILVYAFGGSKYIKNLAKNISKKTGYKIVWISSTYKKSLNIKYIKSAGPDEFLGLFKNAEYILTNSFHGTVFSINFNKQFYTELLFNSNGINSRIEEVLELFELSDRIISSDSVIDKNIEYHYVNEILEKKKSESIRLLYSLICGN